MSKTLKKALCTAGALTFEELGLVLPNPEVTEDQLMATPTEMVSIDFRGPLQGRLSLIIHGDILSTLTANMLGEDSPPTAQQQQDALKEIANVICGNMLPMIAGSDAIFHLGTPKSSAYSKHAQEATPEPSARGRIGLDEGYAELFLYIDTSTPIED